MIKEFATWVGEWVRMFLSALRELFSAPGINGAPPMLDDARLAAFMIVSSIIWFQWEDMMHNGYHFNVESYAKAIALITTGLALWFFGRGKN